MEALKRRHIVLVGLPGAGKSSAGRMAARRLGARFADLDELIESRAGKKVARIFSEDGEAAFRELEARVGSELLAGEPMIIAPGGGFFQQELLRSLVLEAAVVIYLRTSPATAARRLKRSPTVRPLLAGSEPVQRLGELLAVREQAYLSAHQRVTTDALSVEQVADEIVKLAGLHGGW